MMAAMNDNHEDEQPEEEGTANVVPLHPIYGGVTMQKRRHGELILQGVCSHCAHCALKLTDAESVERGLGPVCSKKGYFEEPKEGVDEIQAMIDLAKYLELIQFLNDHYKPKGVRGLVNGLVRVCSLNRKSPVHQACTDAIDSLGYKALASLLRESLAILELSESVTIPGSYELWIKKSDFRWGFYNAIRVMPGVYLNKQLRANVIPAFKLEKERVGDEVQTNKVPIMVDWYDHASGQKMHTTVKRLLWSELLRFYKGAYMKVKEGDKSSVVRIFEKKPAK